MTDRMMFEKVNVLLIRLEREVAEVGLENNDLRFGLILTDSASDQVLITAVKFCLNAQYAHSQLWMFLIQREQVVREILVMDEEQMKLPWDI